jgi:dTDP-4-dehydrorhamnose 3,5-epimerase
MGNIMIDGLNIMPLKVITDERGKIMKMADSNSALFEKFGEIYFSFINPGIIKGWKKHQAAIQLFSVPIGTIKFVIYDDRPDSPTKNELQEIECGEDNYQLIKMPANVWYSWKTTSTFPAMIASLTSEPHNPTEATSAEINNNSIIPYQWQ